MKTKTTQCIMESGEGRRTPGIQRAVRRLCHADTGSRGGWMKVKSIVPTEFLVMTKGKVYDVLAVEKGWYRIIDDSGEDYIYPPEMFEIVEE